MGYTLNDDWEMGAALIQGESNNNLQGYFGIGGDDGILKLTTSGTLNRNEVWLGEVNVSGNVYVPSGKTLTVKTGATINLNGHYIKSTGGTIKVENNVGSNFVKLRYGSTIKALYPTVQQAVNNVGYRYTVELLPKTYNENISIVDKYRRYIKGAGTGNTTINGNITITNSSYTIVSDFSMGDFKTITVNGGTSTNLSRISYNNTNSATYINVYNSSTTIINELNYIASTASFG